MIDDVERKARERAEVLGLDRLHVFVPAIMGVGLIFWLAGELRDLLRATGDASRDKRTRIAGHGAAMAVLGDLGRDAPERRGLRPRPVYALLAIALLGGAAYVALGSAANYARPGGYVSDIAWLLALALLVCCVSTVLGLIALAVFAWWPTPPAGTARSLASSLLTARPIEDAQGLTRPSWRQGAAALVTAGLAGLLPLMVAASPHLVRGFDRRFGSWLQGYGFDWWTNVTDTLFGTEAVTVYAVVVSVAALRCRVFTVVYVTAMGSGMILSVWLRALIDRERPPTGPRAGGFDSFPSGHVLQAVLIATLVPIAVATLAHRRTAFAWLQVLLAMLALGSAVDRVSAGIHWPTDVIGGALIGLALGLGGRWIVANQRAHVRCRRCPWAVVPVVPTVEHAHHARRRDPAHPHLPVGLIELSHSGARLVTLLAHVASFVVVIGLTVMTFTIGPPQNGEGYVFGSAVELPVQLVLAGCVSVGALIGRRWPAVGAVAIAFSATCLGVFAAIEYPPMYASLLTLALMAPAFLLWLSWQHRRTPHEITVVAVITVLLVGSTWMGSSIVYDEYFGPTHPSSTVAAEPVDRVEWVLAGALRADGITVTARLTDADADATLEVVDAAGDTARSEHRRPDRFGVVRLDVGDLAADTAYRYRMIVDGAPDRGRGFGAFRTPAAGPMSFKVVLGSCARVGSNGSVFDALTAEDALLYLMLGDIHYGNIESTEPGPFVDALDRVFTAPAQAQLYRSTPIAYVWNDHDFGPNDADATSPGRESVAAVYRSLVPSYPLPDETSIQQAFTIGRVRFVISDTRSQKTDDSMLGDEQRQWLIDELTTASRTHALVVWANGDPWVGPASPGADGWAGHAAERQAIADAIVAADIHNLVMVSGDAHMVAIDDGSNTGYASDPDEPGGFPLLHAAALDRPGNVKGGPYSEGAFPGGGQYGVLEVLDDGGTVRVQLSGRTWDGRTLVAYDFEVPRS